MGFSERLIFAPGKDADLTKWTIRRGTVPASPLMVCTSITHPGSRSDEETTLSVLICHLEEVVLGQEKNWSQKTLKKSWPSFSWLFAVPLHPW